MKKIVPFKKDIVFDTNIAAINSISLEHHILTKEERQIGGKFIVSGEYQMTTTTKNLDKFEYELPFNISIDKKYDISMAEVDINDFYYEIINSKILSVSIELAVNNLEETKIEEIKEVKKEITKIEEPEKIKENIKEEKTEEPKKEERTIKTETQETNKQEPQTKKESNEQIKSIFDGLDENENYTIYKIHIVTENDTIESIMTDYNIKREELETYNTLSEIKTGDKIIIPANENQ